jgi:iron-sulfur cluster repair protein YtfE (RIC family)
MVRKFVYLFATLILLLHAAEAAAQSQHPVDQLFGQLRREYMIILTVVAQAEMSESAELRGENIARLEKELIPHLRSKEEVLYLALREVGAQEEVKEALRQHGEAIEILQTLTPRGPAEEGVVERISLLSQALQNHFSYEEERIFPLIFYRMDDVQIQRLLVDYLISRRESD